MSNPVQAPSEEEEVQAPPENGDDDEPEALAVIVGGLLEIKARARAARIPDLYLT